MPVLTFELEYDEPWSSRISAMIGAKIGQITRQPKLVGLIEAHPTATSVDDLTVEEKAKYWVSFQIYRELVKFEGQTASQEAQQNKEAEIVSEFPLEANV